MKVSAWQKGVEIYAQELRDFLEDNNLACTLDNLLNGARNWKEYSYGGCSLVYDRHIAERLCSPSELKKKRYGELSPNSREAWLDTQARALSQASKLLLLENKE